MIRNPLFAPGRMAYIIDLTEDITETDIPTTLIRSKSDVPSMDDRPTLTTNDIVINKLAQILSYLRTGPKHLKKSKKRDKQVFDDNIYPELPDYEPSSHKRSEETSKKQSSYFKHSKDEDKVEKEPHKRDEMGWVCTFSILYLKLDKLIFLCLLHMGFYYLFICLIVSLLYFTKTVGINSFLR